MDSTQNTQEYGQLPCTEETESQDSGLASGCDNSWGKLLPIIKGLPPKELVTNRYRFGRLPTCEVFITENDLERNTFALVSKVHFIVRKEENSEFVLLEDLSTNGTFINGKKVGKNNKVVLSSSDEISLAKPNIKAYYYLSNTEANQWLPSELNDKYITIKHLGSGGFADVKLILDKRTCQKFAMKKLMKCNVKEKTIFNEIHILKTVKHPGIIGLEDVIETSEAVFIVLEYMPDGNLLTELQRLEVIREQTFQFIFYQLLKAIEYLHSMGIAHRDLKPENILLLKKVNYTIVKIADFGLAKVKDSMNKLITNCGTLNYVAPEVLLSKSHGDYCTKVDIWSLGVITFISLSGDFPFEPDQDDKSNMVRRICCGNYRMRPVRWRNVSLEARDLTKSMLKVSPKERIDLTDILLHKWVNVEYIKILYQKVQNWGCLKDYSPPSPKRARLGIEVL